MNFLYAMLAGAVVVLSLAATLTPAAASCTCSRQPNGTYFCTCVNNRGQRYCVSCRSSNTNSCSTVSCR
jgi:uncharacterized membrane protein